MEKLLKWSVQASSQQGTTDKPLAAPDPELVKQLFGGPDEATLMKEAVKAAIDTSADEETRETALDNLEMLVESLDNANNLENLGLWEPLIGLLSGDIESSSTVQSMACWVTGTAVQNNDKAQEHFASKKDSIKSLLNIASASRQGDLCSKSLYALSSCLRHCPLAYDKFVENDGWQVINDIIASHQEPKNRIKAASVVNSLLTLSHELIFPKLGASNIIPSLIHLLASDSTDAVERSLRCLSTIKEAGYSFESGQLTEISKLRTRAIEKGYVESDEHPF